MCRETECLIRGRCYTALFTCPGFTTVHHARLATNGKTTETASLALAQSSWRQYRLAQENIRGSRKEVASPAFALPVRMYWMTDADSAETSPMLAQ